MNVELLDEVIQNIEDNPKSWNQQVWGSKTACGTVCCIAGHAVLLRGAEPFWFPTKEDDEMSFAKVKYQGGTWHVSDLAAKMLDLNIDQAEELFHYSNSLEDIKMLRKKFAEED